VARRKSSALPGYSPVKGSSARKYRAPDGAIISRYRYDSLRLQAAGWRNRGELERARRSDEWPAAKKWADRISGRELPRSKFEIALLPGTRQGYQLAQERARVQPDALGNRHDTPEINRPDGPLAQLLTLTGKRPAGATWAVGDSPKKRR
jgi:hypothetical protein